MSVDGTVPFQVAIGILKASQCHVGPGDLDGTADVSSPDGTIHHSLVVTSDLSRHCIIGLARKFDIPPHHFYHPLEVQGFTPEDIQ